jgi:hypothetical protein
MSPAFAHVDTAIPAGVVAVTSVWQVTPAISVCALTSPSYEAVMVIGVALP